MLLGEREMDGMMDMGELKAPDQEKTLYTRLFSGGGSAVPAPCFIQTNTDLLIGRFLKLRWLLSVCRTGACVYVCIAVCALVRTDRE